MMAGLVVSILSVVAIYLQLGMASTVEEKAIQVASQNARLLGKDAIDIVRKSDNQQADKMVLDYASDGSISVAAIFSANKTLIGYYSKIQGIPLPVIESLSPVSYQAENLVIIEPIANSSSNIVGYVYVEHQLDLLLGSQSSFLVELILFTLILLAICFMLAGVAQKLLTAPIKKMVNQLDEFYKAKSFHKRLTPGSNGEIANLVKGFNRLLDTSLEREKGLLAKAKQLQKLIDVRTKQLFKKSHYDSLTGLPNRYLLVDRLQQAISKSARSNENIALLYMDLDRFKIINDNFGHQNGDLLLKEVAKRLKDTRRDGDTVARLGGDEFVFLLEGLTHPKDAARTALRIIESFSQPFKFHEQTLHLSTSIGISIFPDDGAAHEVLLKNADISMYHAKKRGPGNFSYFSDEMNQASLERLAIESNLRQAIENDELHLVYQPQRNLHENCFRNAEALLRWENPELGNVSPGVFIPIAEETGLIKKIDLWVISEVCKQLKRWNEQGVTDLTVAINVSAGHLISSTLFEHLKTEIIVNQLKAEQLEIEITEQVFIEQTERTIESLKAIKALGAKIAIDDFGTGYSSLQYIQDFPADTLKLDGMFIQNLKDDKASQGIVRSTIILAHSLGLEMVAECVEDAWQLEFLKDNGCDLIQGYIYSKPLPPDEFRDMIA
jgi:diguanylate cyclase (GGDEF)-like protein